MPRTTLRQAQTIEHVLSHAYWHLGQQDYTVNEMQQKLARKTDNPQWIATVIARLIDAGYLKNDVDFTKRYCELAFSHDIGPGAIKRKLQQRGIAMADIESAIEHVMHALQVDPLTMASTRLQNKFEQFTGTSKEKVYAHMTTKGFTHAEIDHAISQHPERDSLRSTLAIKADRADLRQEIIKLFNKGKGKTLILQELKQRLIDVTDFEDTVYQLSLADDIDFYQSCKNQLAKKRYDLTDYKEKSKAYAYLTRKGFSSDEIKHAMSLDDDERD